MTVYIIQDKESWYLNKYSRIIVTKTVHSWFKATEEIAESLPQLQWHRPNREKAPCVTKEATSNKPLSFRDGSVRDPCKELRSVGDENVRDEHCLLYTLKIVIYLLIAMAVLISLFLLVGYQDQTIQNHLAKYKELVLLKVCEIHDKMDACIRKFPELELEKDIDQLKELVNKMAKFHRKEKMAEVPHKED